jgi:hypothetical protein
MLARRLHGTLDRLHDDDRGAVAMAAVAACMILFMLSLVLWDAGHAVRDKVDLQNAADSAAYSKAAVNARSMNMLAFTNISKRTVVGIHNTYWGMFIAYAGWTASECATCCQPCPFPSPPCVCRAWTCACRNCVSNGTMLIREALGDWSDFSGFALLPLPIGGKSESVFGTELQALDDYQNYIMEITPWWGWAEQLLRGMRNGATVTASWPPPPDRITGAANRIQSVLNYPFVPNNWSLFSTTKTDGLPVSNNFGGSIQPLLSNFLPGPVASIIDTLVGSLTVVSSPPRILNLNPGGSDGGYTVHDVVSDLRTVFYNTETCSPGIPGMSPMTPGSVAEVAGNVIQHRRKSSNPWGSCSGPSSAGLIAAGAATATTLCPASAALPHFREVMTPVFLNSASSSIVGGSRSTLPDSFGAMEARSNVVFAYKRAPKYQDRLRGNYNILEDDYFEEGNNWQRYTDMPALKSSGQWALSRSEIVHTHKAATPASSNWVDLGGVTQGAHNTWMWHTGWTAKLRPLAFDGEFESLAPSNGNNSYLNSMFHDVIPHLLGGASIMGVAGGNWDFQQMAWDIVYMEKATKAVDDTTVDGFPK